MEEPDTDFDGPLGVLGHAYIPMNKGSKTNGEIHMDEHEFWTMESNPSGKNIIIV